MKRRIPKKTKAQKEWEAQFLFCFLCGYSSLRNANLETHHIISRNRSTVGKDDPANWLRICDVWANNCHDKISSVPKPIQYALKKMHDPDHYDLDRLNQLRRESVTEEDVDQFVRTFERDGEEDLRPCLREACWLASGQNL